MYNKEVTKFLKEYIEYLVYDCKNLKTKFNNLNNV